MPSMVLFRLITAASLLVRLLTLRCIPMRCAGIRGLLRLLSSMQLWSAVIILRLLVCSSVTLRIMIRWSMFIVPVSESFEIGVLFFSNLWTTVLSCLLFPTVWFWCLVRVGVRVIG